MTEDKPSILNKIVTQRRQRLGEQVVNIGQLKLEPSNRSLVDALKSSATGLILECKQSSPSRGLLSDNYQPESIAEHYQSFASAISVLTEPDFFSGSLTHLTAVRNTVRQPVLCKDFVIETNQLYTARAAGADVILLMLSVVSDAFWLECYEIANQLGLDIITEVNNQQEIERAISLPAKIIGINNRNLHTLKTDISVTEDLVTMIPSDRLVISESGISSHQQLKHLAPMVDGFLIGSSLMQAQSIALGLRKLIFGEVKVCGLTRREDTDLAWQSGASYGGIIFTTKSSRYMTIEQAEPLCHKQPMPMVGVFMDQEIDEVTATAERLDLKVVQLHGSEEVGYINQLRKTLPEDCKVWKAISCSETVATFPTIQQALKLKDVYLQNGVDRILIDTPKDSVAHNLDYENCVNDNTIIIAGGLKIDAAVFDYKISEQGQLEQKARAGFDLCSALESAPGIKDPSKLKKLFHRLRPVTRNYHENN